MEAAGLWVALAAALAGIGSAVFAFVQAKAATDTLADAQEARDEARAARDESARLAGEANAAFIRQAEAQEEANRIKLEESKPDDWSLSYVSGQLFKATNSSTRPLIEVRFEVLPEEAAGLVSIRTSHDDGRYEPGDSFSFIVARVMGPEAEKIAIRYRYESDAEDDWRTFYVGL